MATVTDYTALLSGYYWYPTLQAKPVILTYSFMTSSAAGNIEPEKNPFASAMDAGKQGLIRAALDTWASASGVILLETKSHEGDLNFGFYALEDNESAADAGLPTSGAFVNADGSFSVYGGRGDDGAGVVRFNTDTLTYSNDDFTHVALHEIGHALGLKHPFDTDPDVILDPSMDNGTYTVMTYNDYTPRLGSFDIQAVQVLFGNASADAAYPYAWTWDAPSETLRQTGTAAGEYIRGTRANDIIETGGGRDAIVTYAGDDIIYAHGQSFSANAGPGLDMVHNSVARSSMSQFQFDRTADTITMRFGDQTQSLFGVERLGFSDGTLALDIAGNAGQAYRIYQAAFDRTPDAAGLSFWIKTIDAGRSLLDVAAGFIGSQEFASVYGGVTDNVGFISKLYENVLGRAGEAAGIGYWEGQMNGGVSKASVLAGFSESAENITGVAPAIADGIWYV
ncbi:hypothetical protein DEM27_11615 [Metarhizobium album]|uniref:Peptidase metallopeptidase domain-containing protein n=1 Tax=Metarhizobium album TaxID=2182425 RepID=A0A2U2DS98_9HYPH|nr:DUF4214 domain-containing protein [Rhizobium album]PWE56079.1 hypothetical protein DEM27_11615 [Rhizobium album]